RHREARPVQGGDQRVIELKQRFAPSADNQRLDTQTFTCRPGCSDSLSQIQGGGESAAAGAVRTDEVGVTELAHGLRAIFLSAGPQITARETTKDGRPAYVRTLSLQGVENLLDAV